MTGLLYVHEERKVNNSQHSKIVCFRGEESYGATLSTSLLKTCSLHDLQTLIIKWNILRN